MKAVKVQYTVRPEYRETNKANIQKVMEAIKANPVEGMLYSSYTSKEDPNTFIHINIARDEDTLQKANTFDEFVQFRMALKQSEPIMPPKSTALDLVASGFDW